ncbi:MAG: AsmA-like C-terminal region-containing protein, partial [Gammaproteobacteria bacterium]|nr:AsmA-like C-terminal region-containing protein [Gammaproteobacteria bacterium]
SKNTTLELAMQPLHRAWLYKLDAAIAMRVLYGNTQATLHSSWRELASNVKSFRVQLRGQRLPELGELFQSRLPNFLRYDISAKLFLADDNLTGTQILIETPTSFVTGALFYQWPEHTLPVLRLRLAHSTFDVAEMKAAFATNAIVDAALRTTLIPDQPMAAFLDIPLAMDIVGANININEPALPVNKLDFNLRIAPGIIDAKYRIDEISKGRINGALLMASAPQDVALKFNMDVKNFDYGHALSRAGINNNIMGTADATVDFIGRGATIKSLLRNANARIDINGGKGVIVNRYLRLWGDDIVRQFLPGNWLQDEQSKLNCAYARLHLNDGALRAEAMVLDTEHITVVGGGGLDMASEKLDFVLTPNPKNPSLLSLATPVRIRGNLVQPEIATHKMATLWTIGTLAVGVANPVVLLARFANLGNLGEDACRQSAVDAAPHEPSVPVKLVKHLNSLVTLVQRPFDRLPDLDLGKAMGYLGIDVTQEAPQDANGWTPPFSRSTAMEDPAARK